MISNMHLSVHHKALQTTTKGSSKGKKKIKTMLTLISKTAHTQQVTGNVFFCLNINMFVT